MCLDDSSTSIHHQDIPQDASSKRYIHFSLWTRGLTSETSAGKLRLGIDLMSSGTSMGSTAQPAVLLLPLEGNL